MVWIELFWLCMLDEFSFCSFSLIKVLLQIQATDLFYFNKWVICILKMVSILLLNEVLYPWCSWETSLKRRHFFIIVYCLHSYLYKLSLFHIHIFIFSNYSTILIRKSMFHSYLYNRILSKLLCKFNVKLWIYLNKYELYMIGKVESFKCCKGLIGKLYFTPHWGSKYGIHFIWVQKL